VSRSGRRLQERRGATLVLVALLIVLLGCMAALGVDFARAYAGANELQTGADASALAGAKQLQRNEQLTGAGLTEANVVAATNNAFGTGITLASGDVEVGFYNPDAGTFAPGGGVTNAVRTAAQRQTTMRLGGLFNISSLTPRRRGTAWIGNQSTRDCIKPWGIDLSYVNSRLGGGFSITSQAGINELRNRVSTAQGRRDVSVVVSPNANPGSNAVVAPNGFSALTGNSSSRREYQNAIIGQNCEGTADYTVGTSDEAMQPGNGSGDVPRTTVEAVEQTLNGQQGNLCGPNGNSACPKTCAEQATPGGTNGPRDATCYDPVTGVAGVDVTVAAVTVTAVNRVTLNVLMGFKLMCMFRGRNSPPRSGNPNESCPYMPTGVAVNSSYLGGTLVGYPQPTTAVLGPGNGLGNTIGTAQRIILVQ
jgi:Flp pilus assembly protein TadG